MTNLLASFQTNYLNKGYSLNNLDTLMVFIEKEIKEAESRGAIEVLEGLGDFDTIGMYVDDLYVATANEIAEKLKELKK